MKALHLADLHIREKDMEEIARILSFIVTQAQAEQPDLIVIAGDVFDSRDVKIDSQAGRAAVSFIASLADIAPVAIIIGTPSHDGQAPAILAHVRGAFPVIVAEKPMQVFLQKDGGQSVIDETAHGPDAILTLIPQPTKQWFQTTAGIADADRQISQAMTGMFAGFGAQAAQYPGVPHILVYHGGISGAKLSTGQTLTGQDIEVSTDQLNMSGADLHLLGHIHMSQQLGDRTFYAGSPWRTNWGESEDKGFFVHELSPSPVITRSTFIPTPCKRVARVSADYTAEPIPTEGHMFISAILERDCKGVSIRCDFTVWQDEAAMIPREEIRKTYMDLGAADVDIRVVRVPRVTVRAEAVLKAETLRDKLSRMAEIRGEQVPESILQKADELEAMPAEQVIERRVAA